MEISARTTVSLEAHGKVRAGARVLPTVIRKVIRHTITLAVAGVALTACGSLASSSPNLTSLIRTSLDGRGTFRILTSEILPDNVERAIVAALARRSIMAEAVCPEHVLARIGRTFHCTVTAGAGRHAVATVTIVDAGTRAWVAEAERRVLGFVAAAIDRERGLGEISMLAVDPGDQRRGVGSALTEVATHWVREAGARVAMVETGGDPGHAPALV